MRRQALISALLACWAGAALAEEPALARYVTDENADVYVALFRGQAVELTGCTGEAAARALTAMPDDRPIADRTFTDLADNAGLGAHPAIPCADPPPLAEAAWPASAPLWADLADNGRYLLAAPEGEGFYAIDTGCEAIKTALDIRARTQDATAFRGFGAPDPLTVRLTINCGPGADVTGPVTPGAGAGAGGWTLHRAELFLSETGLPETLFVASGPTDAGPGYLPIRRIDGQEIAPLFLEGGARLEAAEAALRGLFAVPEEAPVTVLGFEALDAVQAALFADLCTTDCAGYAHRHGFFAIPGIDFALTFEGVTASAPARDLLGRAVAGLDYGDGRALRLGGCAALAGALGLSEEAGDWTAMMIAAQSGSGQSGAGQSGTGQGGAVLRCDANPAETCTRVVGEALPLTSDLFRPVGECAGKSRLVLHLPEVTVAAAPLFVDAEEGFAEVLIAPAPGTERAVLTVPAGRSDAASPCLPSAPHTMIHARGALRLTLRDVTLRRRLAEIPQEAIGVQMDGGTLVTDGLVMVADGDAGLPPERGISLCTGEYYARATRVHASAIAVQGSAARLAITGETAAPTTLGSARFALAASGGAEILLSQVALTGRVGASLFNAALRGSRVRLINTDPQSGISAALQFRGLSEAQMMQSTAQGFACVGTFWTAGSSAVFTLPGNDLAADNTRVSCAAGSVQILE